MLLSTYESYSGRRHRTKVGVLRRQEWDGLSSPLPEVRGRRGRDGITRPGGASEPLTEAVGVCEPKTSNVPIYDAIMTYWEIWSGTRGAA